MFAGSRQKSAARWVCLCIYVYMYISQSLYHKASAHLAALSLSYFWTPVAAQAPCRREKVRFVFVLCFFVSNVSVLP